MYQVPDSPMYDTITHQSESPFKDLSISIDITYESKPDGFHCKYPTEDLVKMFERSKLFKEVLYQNNSNEIAADLSVEVIVNDDSLICMSPDGTGPYSLMIITLGIFPVSGHDNINHTFVFQSNKNNKRTTALTFSTIKASYIGSAVNLMRISDSWSGAEPDYTLNIDNFKNYILENKDVILDVLRTDHSYKQYAPNKALNTDSAKNAAPAS